MLYGPSGEGKSFVALDWACHVATGQSWLGRTVRQGPVVYVAAEGGPSITKRVFAWGQAHRLEDIPAIYFAIEPIPMFGEGVQTDRLQQLCASVNILPRLVVIDTFARCFVGGEENSAKDVGTFVEAARRIQDGTGATVLLVHHTGKAGDTERGSSALRAASDTMIGLHRERGVIELINTKQKDAVEFDPITVRLRQVDVDLEDHTDTSCIVEEYQVVGQTTDTRREQLLGDGPLRALRALYRLGDAGGADSRAWRAALVPTVAERTFYKWRATLQGRGLVQQTEGHRYRVSDAGRLQLEGRQGPDAEPQLPAPATPP